MTVRETVALWLFLPPPDHLPPVRGDDARVVLHQHPAQHVHRRDLPQPARGGAVVDRLQQRVPVPGVSDRQLAAPRLGGRRPPGGHRRAVAAGEIGHADPLGHPARVRGCQRLQRGPHTFPGQLQPVQRRHRGDHMGGIGALLAASPDQARGRQTGQQRVQRHLLQARIRHLVPELGQDRVIKARVIKRQPQQVLPVDPGPHRLGRCPVGQVLLPLQYRHQRQPRRRPARTAPVPERGRELLILQPLAQPVTDLHRQRPRPLTGVLGGDRRGDLRIRLRPGGRLHAHGIPDSAAGTRGHEGRDGRRQDHGPRRAR